MNMITALVVPSGVALTLYVLGLLAGAAARTRALSWWLLASSGMVTVIFSSGLVAASLMSPLEYEEPVLEDPARYADARHIVVLTAWGSDDNNLPLTARLNASSVYRVMLALELHQSRPDCDIIVSGEPVAARLIREVMVTFGVPAEKVRLEDTSHSTAESARNLRAFVGDRSFFLVTSAGHMPRSLAVLRRQGLEAIPAPTDHQLPKDWWRADAMPRPASLVVSDLAIHEMVGLLWYRLLGRA